MQTITMNTTDVYLNETIETTTLISFIELNKTKDTHK